MSEKTPHLNLQYLNSEGEPLTPGIERSRFSIIDTQVESIFRALGNGVLSGANSWKIQSEPEGPIDNSYFIEDIINTENNSKIAYLTAGSGHVNFMAVETLLTSKIGPLLYDINHVYLYTTESTPLTKKPGIAIFPVKQSTDNTQYLYLGEVHIDSSNTLTLIDQSSLLNVSSISVLVSDLIQHTHGKDGVSKIDLEREIRGLLSSDNISDVDPSRINAGTLNPAIISLSHLLLKDVGSITHEEIDSAIELLQQSNKRLFGELTTTNFLQSLISIKKHHETIDKYFRNLICIIPGYGNIENGDPNNFLDYLYYVVSDGYGYSYDPVVEAQNRVYDETNKTNAVGKNDDAAIVDFEDHEIRGLLSTGGGLADFSIDTHVEFELGNSGDNIQITSDVQWVYGYGHGYGIGMDYFDVWGVASGVFDDLYPRHYGYGASGFEELYDWEYGYGYGYELTSGGNFYPGHVSVSLKSGSATYSLYDVTSVPTNKNTLIVDNHSELSFKYFYDVDQLESSYQFVENLADINPGDILTQIESNKSWFLMSGMKINLSQQSGVRSDFYEPILIYNTDKSDTTYPGYIEDVSSINISIGAISYTDGNGDAQTTYTMQSGLRVRVHVANHSGYTMDEPFETNFLNIDVGTVIEEGMVLTANIGAVIDPSYKTNLDLTTQQGYYIKKIEIYPDVKGLKWDSVFASQTSISKPWSYNLSSTIDDKEGDILYGNIETPFELVKSITSISLSNLAIFEDSDINNRIEKLYIVIPADPAVKLNSLSWVCSEPSDSKVVLQLKVLDSNSIITDPFVALNDPSLEFGNPYCNKSGTLNEEIFTARPSGSTINDNVDEEGISRGTHIEIRATLQPSTDGMYAPSLNSITVHYTTNDDINYKTISGTDGFNSNLQTTSERINLKLTSSNPANLQISHYVDIDKMILGKGDTGYFEKYKTNTTGQYAIDTRQLATAIPSAHQIINNISNDATSVYSTKITRNHDIVVCDTYNHRILIFDGGSLSFKTGIYGSVGLSNDSHFSSVSAITTDSVFSLIQAIYNATEKAIYLVFSHMLDGNPVKVSGMKIYTTNPTTLVLSNDSDYSNSLDYDFLNTLSSNSKLHTRIPCGYYIKKYNTTDDSVLEGETANTGFSNVLRIKISDADANLLTQPAFSGPKEISVTIKVGNDYYLPIAPDIKNNTNITISNSVQCDLTEANIYYRPILYPIDAEVLSDGGLAVCSMIGEATTAGADETIFYQHYRRDINNYTTDASANRATHPAIQFYDLEATDLIYANANGNAMFVDNVSGKDIDFSLVFGGSIKEIIQDGLIQYLIADPGKERVIVLTSDLEDIFHTIDIGDLEDLIQTGVYYPSCADFYDRYYYVTVIGVGTGFQNDNKVLKIDVQDSYETILNQQLSNPMDININAEKLVIST